MMRLVLVVLAILAITASAANPANYYFRLVNSTTLAVQSGATRGVLQVADNPSFTNAGTVCDDNWENGNNNNNNARVACASLGFTVSNPRPVGNPGIDNGGYGQPADRTALPIFLDDVACTGSEANIGACEHNEWESTDCDHGEDVYLFCENTCDAYSQTGYIIDGCPPGTTAGTTCTTAYCGFGYTGTPTGSVTCGANGQYTGSFTNCTGSATCSSSYTQTGYIISGCSAGTAGGSTCSATCAQYYTGTPTGTVTCTAASGSTSGTYSGTFSGCSAPSTLTYRLADVATLNATTGRAGILQVQGGTSPFGTVCDDSFTKYSAIVACRSLGYEVVNPTFTNVQNGGAGYGNRNNLPILLDDVSCGGQEYNLLLCSHSPFGTSNCGHTEDIWLNCTDTPVTCPPYSQAGYNVSTCSAAENGVGTVCTATCSSVFEGTVRNRVVCNERGSYNGTFAGCSPPTSYSFRLVDPYTLVATEGAKAGLLQVKTARSSYGTVCDDSFGSVDASVACRSLGFSGENATYWSVSNTTGRESLEILLDDIGCDGTEANIGLCYHPAFGTHNCGHSEDIAINCTAAPFGNSACRPGQRITGATTCENCAAGTYGNGRSTSCTPCEVGTYSVAGSASCLSCPRGTYASATGASTCTSCAFGKYAPNTGTAACSTCSLNTYTPYVGAASCAKCPSTNTTGSTVYTCPSSVATGTAFTPVTVTLKLTVDIAEITASATARADFYTSFASDISRATGISSSRISITSITAGSVLVAFTILPDSSSSSSSITPADALHEIQTQISNPNSALRSGTYTGAVDTTYAPTATYTCASGTSYFPCDYIPSSANSAVPTVMILSIIMAAILALLF